ncbi:MAG: BCCT family transporter [Gammaproteobacteria bacterium]|nr:BCCT family transporter [Gammaproteobacteria bacterium]
MNHYVSPPLGEGETTAAFADAMRISFFHWGLHPWAIYIVFGLSLAYFHYRHGLPLAPRSLLYPVLGDRINGPIGHGIDIAGHDRDAVRRCDVAGVRGDAGSTMD